jgi:hypothetical protein
MNLTPKINEYLIKLSERHPDLSVAQILKEALRFRYPTRCDVGECGDWPRYGALLNVFSFTNSDILEAVTKYYEKANK